MSLLNMNGNVLCAVDVETTGVLAGWHEIIQIACVPLNHHFEPRPDYRFFYMNLYPDHPERLSKEAVRKHGITIESLEGCPSQEQGVELFNEWHRKLELPFGKRLVPLAHNWGFERAFLIHMLGMDGFNDLWHVHPRDTMALAATINDLYVWHGRKHPFQMLSLLHLCKLFDIPLEHAHDALNDCLATAKLYAEFMRFLHG
ncbi:MAG: 3'-5' exonuclease [Planctomycetota bacterium]|jgi:DNA polymerase III epsilon subunit-like protein